MTSDITIIYVIYKSGDILFKNLRLLKNFKKIIVDNDCKSTVLNELNLIGLANIDYTKLQSNIGISKAAAIGFRKIKTKFFLYLSADTIIDEKNILNLLKIYKKYDKVGLVCPIHLNKDNEYSGNYFCKPINRIVKRSKFQKKIYDSLSKICPQGDFSTFNVWGAPSLFKTSLINDIGFFDQNIFMFFEDVDLCDRIKSNGYEIIETPTAVCKHLKGSSPTSDIYDFYNTISSYKFSELYYFSQFKNKYIYRIYFHSFDYLLRIFVNLFLLNKKKFLSNIFRLVGILRFVFYKKKAKF